MQVSVNHLGDGAVIELQEGGQLMHPVTLQPCDFEGGGAEGWRAP